jgi:aspartyl-tRNA(Asn)/glutamyl-tRNA(Gln) amidotransferase subunit B
MEQGSMRADVNVSVRRPGEPLGTRCEIKNVNSIRFVQAAIEYEARRQVEIIEEGGAIVQETRLFDPDRGETRSLRSKEDAHDYRYFPDPDLLPVELDEAFLSECRASLPELPNAKRRRYEEALGIPAYNAAVLTAEVETSRWFEALLSEVGEAQAKTASNWIIGELFGALNRIGRSIENSPVTPNQGASLLRLIADGTLSNTLGKQVFEIMVEKGDDPLAIVEARGLRQTSDKGAIDAAIADVMASNADKVADYRGGKDKLFGFFVGQVMKAMAGKANPAVVNEQLKKALS